jgi:pyridoxal 5'-phosphate synthase pdxT subunit
VVGVSRGPVAGPQFAPSDATSPRGTQSAEPEPGQGPAATSNEFANLRIGVLALQGAFVEHIQALQALGAQTREVRLPADLEDLDGLILPGGESTSIGKLLVDFNLLEPLREWARAERPIYGTCAGAILLARDIGGLDQPLIGTVDVRVERNAFGRQLQSFETDLPVPALGDAPFHAVFIRAPAILSVGAGVHSLAELPDGRIVAAESGSVLLTCFHPELTDDLRFHRRFLETIRRRRQLGEAVQQEPALR